MKKLLTLPRFYALCLLTLVFSCQKPVSDGVVAPSGFDRAEYNKNLVDESIAGLYEVRDGVLHFKDSKTFDKVFDQMKALDGKQRQAFWKDVQFKSYADLFLDLRESLSNAESKSEYDQLMVQNKDIVSVEGDEQVRPRAGDKLMNHFINRQELVYIGKILYQFGKENQKIAYDGNIVTIKQQQNSKSLQIFDTQLKSPKNARTCSRFDTQREEGGDRRARAYTSVAINWVPQGSFNGEEYFTLKWNIRVTGYPEKKNVWGNWVNYRTDNWLRANINFEVRNYNPGGLTGQKNVNCGYSNYWWDITYDDSISFINLTDPWGISTQQYQALTQLGTPFLPSLYGTGGVSDFEYGCP